LDDLPQFTPEPKVRIDGYTSNLVPITCVAMSSTGGLAVLQRQDHVVRFFDEAGEPTGNVGRQGQGPGEFEALARCGWRADTLWVSDFRLARITLLSTEPAYVRALPPLTAARPAPPDSGEVPIFPFVTPVAVYPGDTLLVFAQWAAGDPLGEEFADLPFLRTTPEGVIQRVVLRLEANPCSIRVDRADGGVGSAQVPFCHNPVWTVAAHGDRIALVTSEMVNQQSGVFTVRILDSTGKQVVNRSIPFDGTPIPAAIIDSAIAAQAEAKEGQPDVVRIVQTDARSRAPSVYPPVARAFIGLDSRLWLKLRATGDRNRWLILDVNGNPMAVAAFPTNVEPQAANATHVWATERDDVDVESIVLYQIAQ
jgi:hypothetical protein